MASGKRHEMEIRAFRMGDEVQVISLWERCGIVRPWRGLVLASILALACHPVRGCAESQFQLAAESRLPTWVRVPTGTARQAVELQASYYSAPLSNAIDNTVFVQTIDGARSSFTGMHWWHPRTQWLLDVYYSSAPPER